MEKFYSNGKTYQQINKSKARRLFDKGTEILFHPCKMRFNSVWQQPCVIHKGDFETHVSGVSEFDSACNHFAHYNCDSERGTYIHFYVEIK